MIQSKIPLLYAIRDSEKRAIILKVVVSWVTSENGVTYTDNEYALVNDTRELIGTQERHRTWDQINSMQEYLAAQKNYSNLNEKQREFAKVQDALLVEEQTKPSYMSTADVWDLSS
jgi:alcohol dehydrogenase class IV